MINKDSVYQLIQSHLKDSEIFFVDLTISSSNLIKVYIDKNKGIGIDECISLNKWIELNLDREQEDYELQVSSPGMGQPFKVKEQYVKHLGRQVKVYTQDGKKHEGKLLTYCEEFVELTYEVKERVEGKKKKETIVKTDKYYFHSELPEQKIKETKVIFSFNN